MANPTRERPVQANEQSVIRLAERLFADNWQPNSGYTVEHLAAQCLDAAEEFDRIRRERTT